MIFNRSDLAASQNLWRSSADPHNRAEAHNIDFDERISPARLSEIEAALPPLGPAANLRNELIAHSRLVNEVDGRRIPPAFQASNVAAKMQTFLPQRLIRLELLDWPLGLWGHKFDDLAKVFAEPSPAAHAAVETFLDRWNRERDNRPVFAAFKDEVLGEMGDPQWAGKLRDCLGLPYPQNAPVALMEYDAEDVMKAAKGVSGLDFPASLPTAFDQAPRAQFFPTPREMLHGCPMGLEIIHDDNDLLAEILHFRLTYRRDHMRALGRIDTAPPANDISTMRNQHLDALHLVTLRETFGVRL